MLRHGLLMEAKSRESWLIVLLLGAVVRALETCRLGAGYEVGTV